LDNRRRRQSGDQNMIRKFIKNDKGATAIEYGLIAALIAVAMITAVKSVGTKTSAAFTTIAGNING
jgi:pilus assembly protein Flp/PilA